MLGLGGNGVGGGQIIALHALDRLPGKGGAQAGVLAVALLAAAVAGVTDQVHDGGIGLVDAAGPDFLGDGMAHFAAQFRVKAGGQTDLLRIAGGQPGKEAVQGLLAEDKGDAQPGLLHRNALDGVGLGGGHAPQLHAADAGFAQQLDKPVKVDVGDTAVFVQGGKVTGKILVGLGGLFLQRHTGEQVVHPLLDGAGTVLVRIHVCPSFCDGFRDLGIIWYRAAGCRWRPGWQIRPHRPAQTSPGWSRAPARPPEPAAGRCRPQRKGRPQCWPWRR